MNTVSGAGKRDWACQLDELQPMVQELLPRETLQAIVKESGHTLYWRMLTPLVVMWGMLFQRLSADHTCDAAVSYLKQGGADRLDAADPHAVPLSQRMASDSASGYVQARARLPLSVVHGCGQRVQAHMQAWLGEQALWQGLAVRLLDGTTYRLRPAGDLVAAYGQAQNQHGTSYWVIVKSLASYCWRTHGVIGHAEAPHHVSETALVRQVMAQDPMAGSLYLMDRGLAVYRTLQVAAAHGQHVLARVSARTAAKLLKATGCIQPLSSGEACRVVWTAQPPVQIEPDLPTPDIPGRLIYQRLTVPGFRPVEVYLFTTLLDAEAYPLAELLTLSAQRWKVEPDYRHLKSDLDMDEFNVHSQAIFQLELDIGLLAYNLIRALMVKAALKADCLPAQLSFTRCVRRIRDACLMGFPDWVVHAYAVPADYLIERLATCRLPTQPNKVAHEPRAVRRRPVVFPALKGDRAAARQALAAL